MAFDIYKLSGMVKKTPQQAGPKPYAEARQDSLDNLEKAIQAVKDFEKEHGKLPTGNDMPAGLVKMAANGDVNIGWRIANMPVFFDQESKDAYYGPCADWEADLRALAAQIEAGHCEDVLVEAHSRPKKEPSPFQIEKRAERAKAKQEGNEYFSVRGKTYVTNTGKVYRK
jgi:hypothetical protein